MNLLHSQHVKVCKGVQEVFEDMESEINNLTEWKKGAMTKINNYKIVIKELMCQLEEVKTEKQSEIEELSKKIEHIQNEHKSVLEEYYEIEKQWGEKESEYDEN